MIKCSKCGNLNVNEAKYCRVCGNSLKANFCLSLFLSVVLIIALIVSLFFAFNCRDVDRGVVAFIYIVSIALSVIYLLLVKTNKRNNSILVKWSLTISLFAFLLACFHSLISGHDDFEAGVVSCLSFVIGLFCILKGKGVE